MTAEHKEKRQKKVDRKKGTPSGFEDTLPAEMMLQNELRRILTEVVERYGFSPLDTPHVEWMTTLRGHSVDDASSKLVYGVVNGHDITKAGSTTAVDKGLRFDLTVSLARMLAQYPQLLTTLPFGRSQWGTVMRGESGSKKNVRNREFIQYDADIVGASGPLAEAEIVAMLIDAMRALKLPANIKLNNRLLLDALVEVGGVTDEAVRTAVFVAIDKCDKVGREAVIAEVAKLGNPVLTDTVAQYLSIEGTPHERLDKLATLLARNEKAREGIKDLRDVFMLLEAGGYGESVSISPEIVRGLGYYTGIIYETYVTSMERFGSVASGGRYDKLIEKLGGPDLPAVGVSFGVSRLLGVLKESGWEATAQTTAVVQIVNFAPELAQAYFVLATQLRQAGIATLTSPEPGKPGPQLKKAGTQKIPYAVIIGPDEHAQDVATVRNLETRGQITVEIGQLVQALLELLGKESPAPAEAA